MDAFLFLTGAFHIKLLSALINAVYIQILIDGVLKARNRKCHLVFFFLGLDLPSALRVFVFIAQVSKNSNKQVNYSDVCKSS